MKPCRTLCAVVTTIYLLATTALTDVPYLINFQGTLTDSRGELITVPFR